MWHVHPKDSDFGQNKRGPTNTASPGSYRGPFRHGCKGQCSSSLCLLCQHAPARHIISRNCKSYLNTVPSPPSMKNKIPLNPSPSSVRYDLFMLAWLAFICRIHRQRHSISQQYTSSGGLSIHQPFKPDLFLATAVLTFDPWGLLRDDD